ncbi:MAG: hypothetical protein ABGF52_09125 [Candidatus Asgardarchaeum sp.]
MITTRINFSLLQFLLGKKELDDVIYEIEKHAEYSEYYKAVYNILLLLKEGNVKQLFDSAVSLFYSTKFDDVTDITSDDNIPFLLSLEIILSYINALDHLTPMKKEKLLSDILHGIDRGYNIWIGLRERKRANNLQKMKGYIYGILGIELMKKEKYDLAADCFTRALQIHKAFKQRDLERIDFFNLGICMLETRRYEEGIHFLKKAALDENDLIAKKYLGIGYLLKKDYIQANEIFSELYYKADLKTPEIVYYLTLVNFAGFLEKKIPEGDKEGQKFYKLLLSMGPLWTVSAHLIRGMYYAIQEDYSSAANEFIDALSIMTDYLKIKRKNNLI